MQKKFQPLYNNFSELFKNGFTIDWETTLFIVGIHLGAIGLGIWLIAAVDNPWFSIAYTWAACHGLFGSLATTVYSHRLIAHNAAKDISNPVHWFFCAFAQVFSVQGHVRRWSANHVVHHGVDRHGKEHLDPYSATWFPDSTRNFLWSHMVTFFFKHPASKEFQKAFEAKNHPIILWQEKHYVKLLVLWIFAFPLVLGFALGGFVGAFALLGGSMMGSVLAQHNTWTVNSVTHMWGFTRGLTSSAVNNYIWLGPMGEGNHHADHHDCPRDYRNGFGLSGWLLDPTRYVILLLSALGLVKGLNRTSPKQEAELIAKRKLANAKPSAEMDEAASTLFSQLEEKAIELKAEWVEAVHKWESLVAESKLVKSASARKAEFGDEIKAAKQKMNEKKDAFSAAVRSMNDLSVAHSPA